KLIAQDLKKGLLVFENGFWNSFVTESDLPAESAVTSVISIGKDSSLVTTLKEGLFILSGNKISKFQFQGLNPFINERILRAIPVNKDWIAIGTHMAGCYIIDKRGNIIQKFSRKEGLQNNTIISLFNDRNHNLWAGLDNGIDFINYNSSIKHIVPDSSNESAGYSTIVYNNKLYLGTSTGLYQIPLSSTGNLSFAKENFKLIPGTKGPAWGLSLVNGNLLLGHHEGALQIKDDKVLPINIGLGYWTFFPINNQTPSSLIAAGSYNGLSFFSYSNNGFLLKETLPGFNESVRFAATDRNNYIWIAQTYKGVFKINLSEKGSRQLKLYTDKDGLPSSLNNRLYKIKNHIIVATEKGIYEHNERLDIFEPSAYFKNLFGKKDIRYLKEDAAGNIWFIEGKNIGVADLSGSKPVTIYFPELRGRMISDFENIYPYNKNNVFVGSDKGFYHINFEQYKKTRSDVQVKIRLVKAIGKSDTLLFGGYFGDVNELKTQDKTFVPEIKYAQNSLHFEYSAPVYQYQSTIQYSYRLEGFDKNWSEWSKKAEKDYTNLPAGTYVFEVRAKTNLGNASAISTYSFKVLPPWYTTVFAYIIYVLLFSLVVRLLYRRQQKILVKQQQQHEEEQKHLEYMCQLELEKAEKEIIALKNEKLQAEIQDKNSELASTSMHLLQRGEVLGKIKEEVMQLKKSSSSENLSEDLKKVIRTLRKDDNTHKDWEQFASHFDNVHKDFLRRLKESHPKLTPNELKLSAYLRMNLSSKEIA
ncbi:MAG TPA: triple tyrosine motif-containing protein, partial [Segetibacter sp.]|nr:triple tyrosine motif-containing protein [Segetibacter sp.]